MQFGVLEKQRPSQAGLIFVMSRFNRSKNWSGAQFVSERSSVLVFLPGECRPPRPGVVMPQVQAGCASSTRDGERRWPLYGFLLLDPENTIECDCQFDFSL